MWEVLDTGIKRAKENMELDAKLLNELSPDGSCILHFYDWIEKSGTYGHFINPALYLNLDKVKAHSLDLARRPTGGGIVFHFCDFAFSALVPAHSPYFSLNTLENYDFINNGVKKALKNFLKKNGDNRLSLLPEEPSPLDESSRHFCMAKPTKYDVMIGNKKVAGAAQRRRSSGYLHQGTISIALPSKEFLQDVLLPHTKVEQAMKQNTFSILGSNPSDKDLKEVRYELKNQLQEHLTKERI